MFVHVALGWQAVELEETDLLDDLEDDKSAFHSKVISRLSGMCVSGRE
jgi:hypothetical protein